MGLGCQVSPSAQTPGKVNLFWKVRAHKFYPQISRLMVTEFSKIAILVQIYSRSEYRLLVKKWPLKSISYIGAISNLFSNCSFVQWSRQRSPNSRIDFSTQKNKNLSYSPKIHKINYKRGILQCIAWGDGGIIKNPEEEGENSHDETSSRIIAGRREKTW